MATVAQLLAILPHSKSQAIHARDIARILNLPIGGNEVETRNLIRDAILQGNVILITHKNGYWLSSNKQEIMRCIASLTNRANEIADRSDALRDAWNNANPQNLIP